MTPTAQTRDPVVTGIVQAAGAVVWRERSGRLEVALVHRPRYQDWSWPKGKLETAETVPAAAAREVAEETGVPVVLGIPLPALRYRTPDGGGKHVRYWAARAATEQDGPAVVARGPVLRAPATEIDDVVWVSPSTASELLTRPTDRAPLAVVADLWTHGRLATRVLAVARHGQARRRSAHGGPEESRPLTPAGVEQARALVPVLAAFGVQHVVTSPWERCLHTVLPYAERCSLPVERVGALTEAAYEKNPKAVAALVRHHLIHPSDAVICTHRPVLPTVLATMGAATRRWTMGQLPSTDPYLRPGEMLIGHVAGRGKSARLVAVEHHRPVRDRTSPGV